MTAPSGLERQVADALLRTGLSPGEMKLVVGASGGPDSTALLRCLHRLSGDFRFTLHVAHLNHDFRGAEADHDASFVQHLADRLGLPCSIDKQDPIAYQRERSVSSFEQAAREMRYSFLAAVAASIGATAVALGHTADDQAETVLLHLLRGSGLHGLRGMAEVAEWPWPAPQHGPLIFRPLLGVPKADTAAYCRALGQTYRQDSGNYMWRFTRNKVRLDLMPRLARDYNPRVRDALSRLSRAATEEVDYIEGELARCWPELARESEGAVSLSAPEMLALHPALRRHALRRAYTWIAGDARRLGESHLEAMLSLLISRHGGRTLDLPRGVRARLDGDTFTLASHAELPGLLPELPGEHTIPLPKGPGERVDVATGGWRVIMRVESAGSGSLDEDDSYPKFSDRLNRDALGEVATLRARRLGDRFQPSGMTGSKKLQDFYTDAKIPREQRDRIPLLVCDNGIAWVVGHRVAGWAVAQTDSDALSITLTPIDGLGDYATRGG